MTFIFLISMIIDALAWIAIVNTWPSRDERLDATVVVKSAAVLGVMWLLKLPLLMVVGVNPFGAIRVMYLTLGLAVPIGSLGLILLSRAGLTRRLTSAATWLLASTFTFTAMAGYATFIEPNRLQLETAELEIDKRIEPLKVGVLADIQTDRIGDHERRAFDMLIAQKPDVIVLPGDMFQGSAEQMQRWLPELRALLGKLQAPGGIYYALGNTDRSKQELVRALAGTPVRLLDNQIARATVRGQEIAIAVACRER